MVRLWSSRDRAVDISREILGGDLPGDIAVVLENDHLTHTLVSLAIQAAKGATRKIRLMHIIIVPHAMPLCAVLPKEREQTEKVLASALELTARHGCEATAEIVHARDAGMAIVEEAKEHDCSFLLLSLVCEHRHRSPDSLGTTVPYVLSHAHCRVWLVHDPPSLPLKEEFERGEREGVVDERRSDMR